MALIPIRIDRTSKPPLGTPLRTDGHWSVQGLEAVPINEGAGATLWTSSGAKGAVSGGANFTPDGLRTNGLTGKADFGPNILPLLASEPWAVYICCFVDTVITSSVFPTVIDIATDSGQAFGIGFSAATSYLGLIFGISGLATVKTDIPASNYQSKWLDIVITYNGGGFGALTSYILSVNGISTPITAAGTFAAVPNATYLGGITGADYNRFSGVVSTFSIWRRRTLSPQQISTLLANKWQIYEPETVWVEIGGGGEIFSGTFGASLENLIQSGVGQTGCGGGITANAGSATYSIDGLEGKQGDFSISIANLLQSLFGKSGNVANLQSTITALPFLLSGNSGNSANFNSQLLSLTQSLNGQHGVSAALVASIGNLSSMFGEQVVFQGTISAVTATFVSSISGITGNIGQALASISVASVISGITGNSGLVQGVLNQISGQWIGSLGVSGSALMYVSTGAEMVGKLGVSASIASELSDIGAYLVEIITGGKIERIVISTKTGSAVILTATGKINITTN